MKLHMQVDTSSLIYVCACSDCHAHTLITIYTESSKHVNAHTDACPYTRAHIHTHQTHTHTYTHIHTHTHTYTHIHTRVQRQVVDCLNNRMGLCTLAMAWSLPVQQATLVTPEGGTASIPPDSSMQEADAASDDNSSGRGSCPATAPSHGLRNVLNAQNRCCVCPLEHRQWEVSGLSVPLLNRQLIVQQEGEGGDGQKGARGWSGRGERRSVRKGGNQGGERGEGVGHRDPEGQEAEDRGGQGSLQGEGEVAAGSGGEGSMEVDSPLGGVGSKAEPVHQQGEGEEQGQQAQGIVQMRGCLA
jgi:hypothetical protein